ncbi:unnamed protein product, partial [marine sediment metagenome]
VAFRFVADGADVIEENRSFVLLSAGQEVLFYGFHQTGDGILRSHYIGFQSFFGKLLVVDYPSELTVDEATLWRW